MEEQEMIVKVEPNLRRLGFQRMDDWNLFNFQYLNPKGVHIQARFERLDAPWTIGGQVLYVYVAATLDHPKEVLLVMGGLDELFDGALLFLALVDQVPVLGTSYNHASDYAGSYLYESYQGAISKKIHPRQTKSEK